MTCKELAAELGISFPWIFQLKKKFPDEAPKTFDDVEAWRKLLEKSRKNPVSKSRLTVLKHKSSKSSEELSDIARLTRARANKTEHEDEILLIELAATKRQVVREEETLALFAKLATIVRGRLMKMANDFPSMLLGLDAPAIDKVVREKLEEALSSLQIPDDFHTPRGVV
jgi:hypothetical protein